MGSKNEGGLKRGIGDGMGGDMPRGGNGFDYLLGGYHAGARSFGAAASGNQGGRGTLTTQALVKKKNRRLEHRLRVVDEFQSCCDGHFFIRGRGS